MASNCKKCTDNGGTESLSQTIVDTFKHMDFNQFPSEISSRNPLYFKHMDFNQFFSDSSSRNPLNC